MVPWGEVTCCLGAAALYLLGQFNEEEAKFLESITRVKQLKDLAQLLGAANKVVVISGRAISDTPINCKFSGLHGVIVEERAAQHFLKQDDEGDRIRDFELPSTYKEVPWYLDDGSARVRVIGARGSPGLLNVQSEVFEESGISLVPAMVDNEQGLQMLGVKRTERVLPTGTPLTVVGEASKDHTGTFQIKRPFTGPFYVSHKSIDQIIAGLGVSSRLCKHISIGCAVLGFCLFAKHAFEHIMERKRHWEFKKTVRDVAAKKITPDNEDSNGTRKDGQTDGICVMCLDQEYNSVFVPCGHMCCCVTCSSTLTSCPLCRTRIGQVVKTFRS